MNIRIAKLEDLEAMVEIYNQAIAAARKTADITPVTIDGRKEWGHMPRVAEFDGLEVGHLYYGLRIDN